MSIKVKDALGKKLRDKNSNPDTYEEVLFVGSSCVLMRDNFGTEYIVSIYREFDEEYIEPQPPKKPSERVYELAIEEARSNQVLNRTADIQVYPSYVESAIVRFLDEQAEAKK